MRLKRSHSLAIWVIVLALSACAAPAPATAPNAGLPANLPDGPRWLQHLNEDLLPFWTNEAALGQPVGNFPSTRCNDGSALDRANPCPEIKDNGWLMQDRNYVVSMSRQTFGYGVAFHLTGDLRYLRWAKAGVDYLRANAFDKSGGGTFAYWDGEAQAWGPEPAFRNPQELAYALLGIGFYYYLTRDPDVLPDLLKAKDHIFKRYYNADLNALQWMIESSGGAQATDRKLVAQLDQLNAYMVLLTPLLPEPERAQWQKDMVTLAEIMRDEFYSPEDNLFFLAVNAPEDRSLKTAGTDLGHSIKAFWMTRFVGLMADRPDLVTFAETNGPKLLERAFLPDTGSWGSTVAKGGQVNPDKDWWMYAELNQFAATMALQDIAQARYLPPASEYYFKHFVDPQYGEVWTGVDAATNQPITDLPKAWPWKSAYHSVEHALVGYITAQQLYGQPVTLHYAFDMTPQSQSIQPYFFRGDLRGLDVLSRDGVTVYTAQFTNVR
jgi:mannose/cellobiose epimerase-like protein (N-acyl-D-glucosamine 2-epimerase family)